MSVWHIAIICLVGLALLGPVIVLLPNDPYRLPPLPRFLGGLVAAAVIIFTIVGVMAVAVGLWRIVP